MAGTNLRSMNAAMKGAFQAGTMGMVPSRPSKPSRPVKPKVNIKKPVKPKKPTVKKPSYDSMRKKVFGLKK